MTSHIVFKIMYHTFNKAFKLVSVGVASPPHLLLSLLTSLAPPSTLTFLISSEEPFSFLLGITVHNSCPRLPGTKFPFLHPSMLSSGACPPSCPPSRLPLPDPSVVTFDLLLTSFIATLLIICSIACFLGHERAYSYHYVFIAVDVTEGFTWRKCSKCWMKKIRCLSPRELYGWKVYTACLNSVVPIPGRWPGCLYSVIPAIVNYFQLVDSFALTKFPFFIPSELWDTKILCIIEINENKCYRKRIYNYLWINFAFITHPNTASSSTEPDTCKVNVTAWIFFPNFSQIENIALYTFCPNECMFDQDRKI